MLFIVSIPRRKYHGIIGDCDPVAHGGAVVYSQGRNLRMAYFQPCAGDTYVYTVELDPGDHAADDWEVIAQYVGATEAELVDALHSDDPLAVASAIEAVGLYWGFSNLTCGEVEVLPARKAETRWGRAVDAAHRAASRRRNESRDSLPSQSKKVCE